MLASFANCNNSLTSSKYELGAKMGFDATTKIGSETDRKWGDPIVMDEKIIQMVDKKWSKYGF